LDISSFSFHQMSRKCLGKQQKRRMKERNKNKRKSLKERETEREWWL
jgi:hypothetical protein